MLGGELSSCNNSVILIRPRQVIMIARLHAMYQGSRIMLIFLVIILLAINIGCGVLMAIASKYIVMGKLYLLTWRIHLIGRAPEVLILSGTYMCDYEYEENAQLLISMLWMLYTIWEVLALCLSVRVAVKHFHDLRRLGLSRSIIGDCFRVLVESHVLYFARWDCNANTVIFSAEVPYIPALSVSRASNLLFSLQSCRYADLSLTSACNHCSPSL
jgi:hypothetical protein